MKFFLLLLFIVTIITLSPLAVADDAELSKIKNELEALLLEKMAQKKSGATSISDRFVYTGLVQVEATRVQDFSEDKFQNDFNLTTFELGLAAALNKNTVANMIILYEEDTDPKIDVATLHFSNEELTPLSLTVGKSYLSFGSFETNFINNTLALELAEIRTTNAMVGFIQSKLDIAVFVYDGNKGNNFGAIIGYTGESFTFGVDYINDIGANELIAEQLNDAEDIAAYSVHGGIQFNNLYLILEYLQTASIEVFGQGALNIKASQIEAAYSFNNKTIALAFQQTDEGAGLLPKQRSSLGVAVEVSDNLRLSIEYWRDRDYDIEDGGSEDTTNNVNLQLLFTF